jgi:transposase
MFVGVDVSKQFLDVATRPTGESIRLPIMSAAITTLIDRLRQAKPQLVVLEATGGFERLVAVALAEAKIPS